MDEITFDFYEVQVCHVRTSLLARENFIIDRIVAPYDGNIADGIAEAARLATSKLLRAIEDHDRMMALARQQALTDSR